MANQSLPTSFKQRSQQSGAVLVVTLILLIVMMSIVTSTSTNSTLSEKMAANSNRKNLTEQTAQSAIDNTVTEILNGESTLLQEAINQSNRLSGEKDIDFIINENTPNTINAKGTIQARFVKDLTLGSLSQSLDANENSTIIRNKLFELTATGSTIKGIKTTTIIRQGIEVN